VEALSNALAEYTGTVVVVSHDDYFISKIATRIIEVRPGLVRDFPGNLTDYRAYVEEGLWGANDSAAAKKKEAVSSEQSEKERRIQQRDQKKKLQRLVEKLEREIDVHEQEIGELQKVLDDQANAYNHVLLAETAQKIESKKQDLDSLMEAWELRHTELEAMKDS
jgi:ATP-binding cassette, subfamily F, member 3